MSDNNFTNNFYVHGDGNTVNFSQTVDAGSHGNEALGLVLKFLLQLLLSPILIPLLLAANGYKRLADQESQEADA